MRRLTEARDVLNAHADRMHLPHPQAVLTPYEILGQVTRLRAAGHRPSDVRLDGAARWTSDDQRVRQELLAGPAGLYVHAVWSAGCGGR